MIIKPAKRLGQVKEYYFSKKLREIAQMKAAGKKVLNLGIGSPDLAPAAAVIETLNAQSLLKDNHAYQNYKGLPTLRTAFANWYRNYFDVDLDPESEILPLIGSKEGIMHISMTFLEQGDEVLVPNPGYPAYAAVANLTGASIRYYNLIPEKGWLPSLEHLESSDLSKVKMMWVNYPNMPTGAKGNLAFFEELIGFAKKHQILLCNDNPYAFILNEGPTSILKVDGAKEVALELNSLSKAHNMAGWRVGMLGGAAEYINQILRFKTNMDSGMFKPVQLAAVAALQQPQSWYDSLNQIYLERQTFVYKLLRELECECEENQQGMFVWAKIPDKYNNGYELSDEVLYNYHVFITPGGIFGSQGEQYVRVSLCSPVAVFEEAIHRIN